MKAILHLFAALGLATSSGCFLAHELGGDGDGEPRADAGRPGPSESFDAGPDPLEPAMPDEDRGPDSRPSDYDDADDWEEPPEAARCCDLEAPILVADRPLGSVETASLAFSGSTWGVFVPKSFRDSAEFIELERLGAPTGHRLPLGVDTVFWMPAHWYEGRFLVSARTLPGTLDVSRRDRTGRPEGPWSTALTPSATPVPWGHDVGWLTHGRRTVTVAADERGGLTMGIAEPGAEPRPVVIRAEGDAWQARIAGLRSRAALAVRELDNRVTVRSVQGTGEISEPIVLARGDDRMPRNGVAVAALRDVAIVAYEQDDQTFTAVYDPFEERLVSGPRRLSGEPTIGRVLGLGADDKRNLIALCRRIGDTRPAVVLDILDADGRPLGPPVPIAGAGSDRPVDAGLLAGGCSVGADSTGFLVAYSVLREGIWVRRATLRTD